MKIDLCPSYISTISSCIGNLQWVKNHKDNIVSAAELSEETYADFMLQYGLCWNCDLNHIHGINISEKLSGYYLGEYPTIGRLTLLEILFVRYCEDTDNPIDTIWPCGATDGPRLNYGEDVERWEFLDFMIENLQYILDNHAIKGIE